MSSCLINTSKQPSLQSTLQDARTYVLPLVQIRQVDFAVGVNVLSSFYHHGAGRFDKTYWRVVGIRVQQPQTYGDVVDIAYRKHNISLHGNDIM